MLGSIFNTKLQTISEVLYHSPSHFLRDRGDRLSSVAFSLVDQWSSDDADTYCPLSRVSNCRSQRNVSGPFYFTTRRHKLSREVTRSRSSRQLKGQSAPAPSKGRWSTKNCVTANNRRGPARNYEESNAELHTSTAIVLWKWRPTFGRLNFHTKISITNKI